MALIGSCPAPLGDHKREVRLTNHGNLTREIEHSAVRRNESIPCAIVVMEGEEDLPIIHVGHEERVNIPKRNELRFKKERV